MADDRIEIEIALKNAKAAVDALEKIGKTGTTSATKTEKSFLTAFNNIKLGAIAAVAVAVKVFQTFTNTVGKAVQAAADKAEELEKFKVVFRGIEKGAIDMAKVFAREFNLADSTVIKMYGSLGDLLTGFGFTSGEALKLSDRIARLGTDLAAFNNFSEGAEGASRRLLSALTGETEGLKALGIVVRQDTKEFSDNVEKLMEAEGLTVQQAKAQAILNEAYRQSPNAIGAAVREQESFNAQSRELGENIKELAENFGERFLPAVLKVVTVINKLFDSLNIGKQSAIEASEAQKKLNEQFSKKTISELKTYIANKEEQLKNSTELVTKIANEADAMRENGDAFTRANKPTKEYTELMGTLDTALKKATDAEGFANQARTALANKTREIIPLTDNYNKTIDETTDAYKAQAELSEAAGDELDALTAEWKWNADAVNEAAIATDALNKKNAETTTTLNGVKGVLSEIGGTEGALAQAIFNMVELGAETDDTGAKMEEMGEQAANAGKKAEGAWNSVLGVIGLVKAALNELSFMFEFFSEIAGDEGNSRAEKVLISISKILTAMATGSPWKVIKAIRDVVMGGREAAAEEDAATVAAGGTGGAAATAQAQREATAKGIIGGSTAGAVIGALTGTGPIAGTLLGGLIGGRLSKRATGGPVMAGAPYLVGERGPELMVPGSSGTVIPNNAMGKTVNINGPVTIRANNPREFMDALNRYQRENGALA